MYYYEITLLKSPLKPLTYKSDKKIDIGMLVFVPLRNRKKLSGAVVIKEVDEPSFKCVEILDITNFKYNKNMFDIAKFISQYYVCSLGEAFSLFNPYNLDIKKSQIDNKFEVDIELSNQQKKAYDFLQKNKTALLFANTGSGKTEIYIKVIQNHLNNNKQALLLMPEISLTPQMQHRLEKAFGSSIAIWHSKVTKKKKEKILQELQENKIKLIAGARSALFLPFVDLGVIVVDEEHDESYKSDQKPRYHAKDLAVYIANKFDIQLVLGSATPSINSFSKIPYYRLKETYHNTNTKIIFDDSKVNLSNQMIDKIHHTFQKGEQVIVFLPTRANYKYQICSDCAKAVQCPFCSVGMSLHKNDKILKCHYCNYSQTIPNSCPSCGTGVILNLRVGTAQIQEELLRLFPNKTIQRFDRDSVKTDTQLRTVLKKFNDKKIDMLVGTQMLSKGHDYHNVTLAIILGIDSVLNMESYKSRQKAISLLLQTAGRSGRNGKGEVIVQTANQEIFNHYLYESDYEEFLEDEIEFAKGLYPPHMKLAKVVFAHTNAFKAQEQLNIYLQHLKKFEDIELIGSGESAIFKIANRYRYEMMLRSLKSVSLLKFLHSIDCSFASIDMDTLS
jgi:primosomal protein N' (replication factor Y)